jgi:hypothetical protein
VSDEDLLPVSMTITRLRAIRRALDAFSFVKAKGREASLQAQLLSVLEPALPEAGWVREHRLEGGRLDLWSPEWRIAIESKVGAQAFAEVLSQLSQYLRVEDVHGLMLVTRRHALRALPHEMHGKPLSVYWLGAQL